MLRENALFCGRMLAPKLPILLEILPAEFIQARPAYMKGLDVRTDIRTILLDA